MKKIVKMLLALICAFAMSFTTRSVAAVDTEAKAKKDDVTYTLEADGSAVTNGRIAVTFNENELELLSAENSNMYEVEDLNLKEEADENGNKTIYFAFASTEASSEKGTTVTLKFRAKEAVYNKDVEITTTTLELYNGDENVAVETDTKEDLIHIEMPTSSDTGDDSNIMTYVGLMVGAAAIAGIAFIGLKKKKA